MADRVPPRVKSSRAASPECVWVAGLDDVIGRLPEPPVEFFPGHPLDVSVEKRAVETDRAGFDLEVGNSIPRSAVTIPCEPAKIDVVPAVHPGVSRPNHRAQW